MSFAFQATAFVRGLPRVFPRLSLRCLPVWQRNFLVWRKHALTAILGNLADPLIYMLGLGYGLGSLLPEVGGVRYITFLAAGTVVASTMNAATFEALYSAFTRMQVQKTWEAILNAPVALDDVLFGELLWCTTKSMMSGMAILLVIWGLGLSTTLLSLWTIPVIFLAGLAFSAMGLVICALAPGYDFFMYYFTLFVTPMLLVSGVFFPARQLPDWLQGVADLLPLTHAVELARPLLLGEVPAGVSGHVIALLLLTVLAFCLAVVLMRRRHLQ